MSTALSPRIVGGHLGLDLVNTVAPRTPSGEEHEDYLTTAQQLLDWSRRVGVLSDVEADAVSAAWATAGTGDQALRAVWEIREATYEVLEAALSPAADRVDRADHAHHARPADTLDALGRLFSRWTTAIARGSLAPAGVLPAAVGLPPDPPESDDGRGVARIRYGDVPAWLVPDRLAAACVELVQTVDVHQLKACPLDEGGCGWLFLDRSRNGSRRWCTMEDCGAHAKARRLTERRRRSAATGETS
jgi:predicted RNA-binding Zn ribbon-like protein